ncbi:peptidyl-prolyl cis-trans isomerase [Metabacillus litoralis]|uniref:peptidyl-prolyl cis-trans isomerase n=1 Tax=Metabacillus TaxID=2675233 RepID=UPI001B9973CE|nr:peptidyl-prolyl cis-trans isomerase [Metabacillus litoralis]MCM3160353.1 peptidyl-prolyl cis-trans isomerase [Metabacillus litoralis]MCM3408938.1 peptidyl-prolyl cis-trans isomerase [Metabacillus litoralis]UHA59421.1 peptidyl-prolyl cis-trans isomerase [Metabacillus litoralis]
MNSIIIIKGKVNYQITLDPGVWIFDDRKVDLTTYFHTEQESKDELEEYTKAVSKHWEREIREGAIYPPTLKTERTYEREKILNGTFGIPFKPFLQNAEFQDDAKEVQFITKDQKYIVPLEDASEMILGFSKKGKPLKEDGPIHVYYGNGSNIDSPITHVKEIIVS